MKITKKQQWKAEFKATFVHDEVKLDWLLTVDFQGSHLIGYIDDTDFSHVVSNKHLATRVIPAHGCDGGSTMITGRTQLVGFRSLVQTHSHHKHKAPAEKKLRNDTKNIHIISQ